MPVFLLSPSEKELIKAFGGDGIVSPLPESKGADVLVYTKQGLLGIQRKSVPHDFLASISDGRMVRETSLLPKECKFSLLLLEGRFRYYPDGHLSIDRHAPSRYTRSQIRGMLFDIWHIKSVPYDYTENTGDTASYIRSLVDFMNENKHLGMFRRPHAEGSWYVPSARDVHLWILQSFQGIGPSTAAKIIEHFGSEIPIRWTCTIDELKSVPGLSRKKAEELYSYLPPGTHVATVAAKEDAISVFDGLRRRLRGGL